LRGCGEFPSAAKNFLLGADFFARRHLDAGSWLVERRAGAWVSVRFAMYIAGRKLTRTGQRLSPSFGPWTCELSPEISEREDPRSST
jgi:hypothetical protein